MQRKRPRFGAEGKLVSWPARERGEGDQENTRETQKTGRMWCSLGWLLLLHCSGIQQPPCLHCFLPLRTAHSSAEMGSVERGPWPGFHPDNAGPAGKCVLLRQKPPKTEEMSVCMSVCVWVYLWHKHMQKGEVQASLPTMAGCSWSSARSSCRWRWKRRAVGVH